MGTPLLVLHIEPAGAITVSDFNPSASRLFDHQLAKGSLLDTLLDVETLDTLKPIIHNTHNLEPGPGTPFHLHQKNGHTRVLVCRVCLLDQQHHLLLTLVDKTGGSTLLPPPKNIAMLSDETKAILNWLPVAIEISSANINTADTLFINNKFFEIFGYTPEQDVITLDEWWEVAYPDPSYRKLVSETWLAAVKEATEKGMDMPPQIWEVHCKDGSKKNIEFRFRAIGDKYVNVYVDVTEQLALAAALRKQANIDPLTNIANRRYFFQQADDFILQASQRLTPLSVLIMDIDFFKIINDRYGHEHGDETLKEIVLRTQHCLSTSALFARMGGEEFAILLPDTPLELANQIAWQICEHIGQTPVRVLDNEIPVTTSIGVATLSSTEHDINSVLRRADEALYKAKATGRNRVVSAT